MEGLTFLNQNNQKIASRRKVIAARYGSRGLAYLSTAYHVSRLNCWVRNGSRCFPTAMAAITTDGLLVDWIHHGRPL